tara:strand:- start:852 stop:1106 length:255 start_codon:yes stop_codon:yes gene_type:complete
MTNYLKGRRKEYKLRTELLKLGWDIVQRSAGSHSPIDVWAVNKEKKLIKLIQAKPDSMSDNKRKQIEDKNKWLNGTFEVTFEVM